MPQEYTPSGSSFTYTIPAFGDVIDGETVFRSFADDVASADAATAATAAAAAQALQYIVTNAQAGSYTLQLSDAGRVVEMSGGGTLTVPTNGSVPFPVGSQITILQTGASQVSIAPADGTVTLNSAGGYRKIAAQWSAVTLLKRGTNTWVALGALVA